MYIYTLTDPRTGVVRYVGSATNALNRFKEHRRYSHSAGVRMWVAELRLLGMEPLWAAVQIVPASDRLRAEYAVIAQHVGAELLNVANTVPLRQGRVPKTFRFSKSTIQRITDLMARWNCTATAAVVRSIDTLYKESQHGITEKTQEVAQFSLIG